MAAYNIFTGRMKTGAKKKFSSLQELLYDRKRFEKRTSAGSRSGKTRAADSQRRQRKRLAGRNTQRKIVTRIYKLKEGELH